MSGLELAGEEFGEGEVTGLVLAASVREEGRWPRTDAAEATPSSKNVAAMRVR